MITRRRLLLGSAAGLLLPTPKSQARFLTSRGSGASLNPFSPDGTFIVGGSGSLVTAHGTWSFGSTFAPEPGYGVGPFFRILLNGQPAAPNLFYPNFQKLMVDFGGNLYGLWFDQTWNVWQNNIWAGNDGVGLVEPAPTPVPPALPTTWAGPYTPSADGTTISGGTGTVTTREGVWTFGAAGGGGWNVVLNGQLVGFWFIPQFVTQMKVGSGGWLFFQSTDTNWYVWIGNQYNLSSAPPISGPIPVGMAFSPSLSALIHVGDPAGTFVTAISVTMSDLSAFTGSLSVSLDNAGNQSAVASGMNIVKSSATIPAVPSVFAVTATQNGSTYAASFDMLVIP